MSLSTKILCLIFVLLPVSTLRLQAQRYASPPAGAYVFTSLAEAKENPDQVEYLILKRKRLTEFPPEILAFENLKYLDISRNKIRELPSGLGQLKNLEFLNLSKNQLQILTPEISQLKALKTLVLSHNAIGYIPDSLCAMTSLRALDVASTNVVEFPECMNSLATTLELLNMRYLQMTRKDQEKVFGMLPATRIYYTAGCRCGS